MNTVLPDMNFSANAAPLVTDAVDREIFSQMQVFRIAESAPASTLEFEETDKGTYRYKGYRVFRTGTFRDSWGDQTTWEPEHLQQMAFHANLLRERGIFPNPVVRHNHPSIFGGGGDVIGYVDSVYTEKDGDVEFLVADFEITEPEAHNRIQRGTYRARSAEVGTYLTNDEAMFWPVFKGFAFVDIPAVEGLFSKGNDYAAIRMDKEHEVSDKNKSTNEPTPPSAPPQQTTAPDFVFRVAGQETRDFAAVQAHITELETANATLLEAQRQQAEQFRKDFVSGLSNEKKIGASQVESLQSLVVSMTDEQFSAFQASYKDAPTIGILESPGETPPSTSGSGQQGQFSQEDTDFAIVDRHMKSGMKHEHIKSTASYKRLEAVGKAPALSL